MTRLAYISVMATVPALAVPAPGQPRWFVPPPAAKGALLRPNPAYRWSASGRHTEEIRVIGHRAPIQRDPYEQAPLEPLRTYESGSSWGSTHPGEFCCASQYETGLDGQPGR